MTHTLLDKSTCISEHLELAKYLWKHKKKFRIKVVQKNKTRILCPVYFFCKSCGFRDNDTKRSEGDRQNHYAVSTFPNFFIILRAVTAWLGSHKSEHKETSRPHSGHTWGVPNFLQNRYQEFFAWQHSDLAVRSRAHHGNWQPQYPTTVISLSWTQNGAAHIVETATQFPQLALLHSVTCVQLRLITILGNCGCVAVASFLGVPSS
jgi:hypothetical protein